MDDRKPGAWRILWLLVAVAVGWLWWSQRPDTEAHVDDSTMSGADPDDVLVDLRDDVSPATVAEIERALGIDLVLVSSQSQDERFYRAHVDPSRRDAILAALAARPEVEIAEPDSQVFLAPDEAVTAPPEIQRPGFPNDPKFKHQWHLRQIGMPAAWKLADGDGTIVAVIDTGVAFEKFTRFHQVEDLAGLPFVKPYNFVGDNTHANDDHGHGTHVAGTIAQVTDNGIGVAGIARNVKIMPLKVLSAEGSGSVGGIADAIRFAADNGAKVINMSLGGPFPSKVLEKACTYAIKKGVVVVAAAGNESRSRVGYPAANPGVIAVAATRYDEQTTFYSNWGKDIDIAAPGGDTRVDQDGDGMNDGVLQNTIVTGDPTRSDYFGYMGTSMASPHVAGVAALVVGEGVTDPAKVEQVLQQSARKPSKAKYERDRYGAGILDAKAAVLAARADAGGVQFGLGLLIAAAVASTARRRMRLGWGYAAGALAGASGLFFLPYLAPSVSSWPGIEMMTRGLPSWDLSLLGSSGHGNALFFSALVPVALVALAFGLPKLRPALAGLAAGVAAHLLYFAAAPMMDIRWMPNVIPSFDAWWLLANALGCIALARLVLRR